MGDGMLPICFIIIAIQHFNNSKPITVMFSSELDDNDEIHHSVGKVNFDPCPSESHTQFAPSGASSPIIPSSLITESPPITISPPGMTLVLEQQKLDQGEQPCRVQYNIFIVNHGGNLTIEGTMVNIKQLITIIK